MEISKLMNEQSSGAQREQFASDVLAGLCSSKKNLSAKYFYDDIGSDLFQKITKHEDYYLTRTEFEVLENLKSILPLFIEDDEIDIIELGAGDGHKSQLVIQGFLNKDKKVNFYPIDISEEAMNQLERTIEAHENLTIHGVVADYMEGVGFLKEKSKNRKLVLFLGSNIGNFNQTQSEDFLRELWKNLDEDDLALIGFDLKKSVSLLTAAYNDSSNHTRDFNLNLLSRINNELGANFDINMFEHLGVYNPESGAMESYLLPTEEQVVYVEELERSFHFDAFEPLHLEYSFKYLEEDIERISELAGFAVEQHFTDEQGHFIDSLWRVKKEH